MTPIQESANARWGKRCFDLLTVFATLPVLAPTLVAVAVMVRLKLGSPVLFVQARPGRHGRSFRIYKFRTMTDGCDEDGRLLSDAERLTGLGTFLRRASLDELPELINVLR